MQQYLNNLFNSGKDEEKNELNITIEQNNENLLSDKNTVAEDSDIDLEFEQKELEDRLDDSEDFEEVYTIDDLKKDIKKIIDKYQGLDFELQTMKSEILTLINK